MEIDYKIVEEKEVDGVITYQRVRFYSGQEVQETATNPVTGVEETNIVYRRTALLDEVEYFYAN